MRRCKAVMNKDFFKILELNYIIEDVFFKGFQDIDLPYKFSTSQIKTLINLDTDEDMTMSEVSKRLNIEKGSFTPVANKLIDLGCIEKKRSTEDKRISYLVLTDKGSEYVKILWQEVSSRIEEKLRILSEEERDAYFASMSFIVSITKKLDSTK
jgi:DNA-binding MarR family transcriptional regulator